MDRSKWEYKKLTDVCSILYGYPFDSKCFNENNQGRPLIRIRDVVRGFTETYTTEDCSDDYIIKEGEYLVGMDGEFNISAWKSAPALLNQRVCKITADGKSLTDGFMYYLMKTKLKEIEGETAFVTVKHLSAKVLNKVNVHLPSIDDQQRIAAELDCLNEMIALKQDQLKEFDKLAQSIFYDMFGDPVTNEKGWDVIELGARCEVTSFKRVLIEDVVDSGVPFIRGTELMALSKATKGEKIDFTLFITPEHYEQVKAISGVPAVGDLLIPSINSEGNIWILDTDEPRYYKDGRVLWVHVNHDAYTSEALKFIMHILLKKTYSVMATGATFAELKLFVLRELKTILPPLALQQQFAEKIKAIEVQKELVKKSIAETQQLLASRMDYYFD